MSLVDALNKLITEHGSAGILRTHLELVRDQVKALEAQNGELQHRLKSAEKQLDIDAEEIKALKDELECIRRSHQKPEMKYGCLLFPEDETLYCPSCFYKDGKKIPTSRKGMKFRFCAVCRTDIPSG